jgi:hypothetical protein
MRVTKRRAVRRIDLPVGLQVLQDGLKEVVRGHAVLAWCAIILGDARHLVAQECRIMNACDVDGGPACLPCGLPLMRQ